MKFLKNKKFLMILAVILAVVLGRAINALFFQPTESGLAAIRSRQMVVKEVDDKDVVQTAVSTLEKPDEELSGEPLEQVLGSLNIALAYLEGFEDLEGIESSYVNRLSITSDSMLQTLATMVIVDYQFQEDSLKVYRSEAENVYQFLFMMSHPEREDISFVGNYVTGTQQLEIVSMKGNPINGYEVESNDLVPVQANKQKEEK